MLELKNNLGYDTSVVTLWYKTSDKGDNAWKELTDDYGAMEMMNLAKAYGKVELYLEHGISQVSLLKFLMKLKKVIVHIMSGWNPESLTLMMMMMKWIMFLKRKW
jgi:hypothetical protein